MDKIKGLLISSFVLVIFVAGFWFRLNGITNNQSFWADEAYAASVAREITIGKSVLSALRLLSYQKLHVLTIAVSFRLLGVSEFSARLLSVLWGSIGIFFAFLIAKRLTNWSGGMLAAFLMAFSQLNLANSTQAKPYAALQTLLLIQSYLLIYLMQPNNIKKKSKQQLYYYLLLVSIDIVATLYHIIGILFWITLFVFLILHHRRSSFKIIRKPIVCIPLIIIIALVFFYFGAFYFLIDLFKPYQGKILISLNNTVYFKNLLGRQYAVYLIPALFGMLFLYKKSSPLVVSLFSYSLTLLFMWNFRSYSHNLRYLVPFFGLVFVFFGVFWGRVGESASKKLKVKSLKLLPILVIVVIYLSGYKIVKTPQVYYSPNFDFYGDVQNADYKNMYSWIKKKYGKELNQTAIFNDLVDTERYYLERPSNAYFMKGATPHYRNGVNGVMVYETLDDFLKQKAKSPKGILIIEDWESILPEDIKQYAKKNLKLEYRVEKMAVGGERDVWPLEVRSWGMD